MVVQVSQLGFGQQNDRAIGHNTGTSHLQSQTEGTSEVVLSAERLTCHVREGPSWSRLMMFVIISK